MTWLLVAAGAAVGAPLRYLTDRAVQARHAGVFPWGTFVVNVTGCFILGCVAGAGYAAASHDVVLLIGTGFCGALTTYSTFSYETLRLAQDGPRWFAPLNVLASIVVGVAAAAGGAAVTPHLFG